MINSHIFKMELKRSLKGLLAWCISISLFVYLIIILYPLVKDMYSNIPEELLGFIDSFGGIPENVVEYFAIEGGMVLQIVGSIFAALVGFNIINKEERSKHSELVYTLPLPRKTFFFTKLSFAIFQILIYSLSVTIFSVLGFLTVDSFPYVGNFLVYSLMNTLMLLMIAFFGFTLACIVKNTNSQVLAMVIPLPLYIISIISSISKNKILKSLKHFTVFSFADPVNYLKGSINVEWISFSLFLTISLVGLVYSYHLFINREFNI